MGRAGEVGQGQPGDVADKDGKHHNRGIIQRPVTDQIEAERIYCCPCKMLPGMQDVITS